MAERANVWKAVFPVVLTVDFGLGVLERVRTVVVHVEAWIKLLDRGGLYAVLLGEEAALLVEHGAVQAHLHLAVTRRDATELILGRGVVVLKSIKISFTTCTRFPHFWDKNKHDAVMQNRC